MSKSYHRTACFISLLALGCGGSTEPDPTRHFLLYTWQFNSSTYIVGDRVVIGGNFVEIDSATVDLRTDGTVQEGIWYVYAVPSTGTQTKATESFHGRWLVNASGLTEIHLPLPGGPDATVGSEQPGQQLPLFRSWTRAGASFGGNFLYLKR